jgi:putative phage-type endonuclease
VIQGSPEWKLARAGKVTASRLDAVMAKGRGNAPSATREDYMAELIAERLTGMPYEDGFVSFDMRRGMEVEPAAALAYEVATGTVLETCGVIDHPSIPWTAASPDRLAGEGLVETKCPKTKTHLAYLQAGRVPADYIAQMTWQLVCTNRPWCDFVSFDPRLPDDLQLFIVRYVPTPEYIATVEDAVITFLAELDDRLAQINRLRRGNAQPE